MRHQARLLRRYRRYALIPPLMDKILPPGIHDCTMDEVEATFGRFQRSDRRIHLTKRLSSFIDDARQSGIVAAVIIDGSYATAKQEPGDVDLIIVLRADFDLSQELRPFEYNVRSRRMVKQVYRFDVFVDVEGSESYATHCDSLRESSLTTPSSRPAKLQRDC
jgi:hypothetical protein